LEKENINFKTIFTGQHKELYEDVKHLIPNPDYNLNIMSHNQTLTQILSNISIKFGEILNLEKPDLLIVQGDTTTVAVCALIAYYEKISIGHVEAGLRTYNLNSPFPEEGNRQIVSRIANFNWAPTNLAAEQLKKENAKNIYVTGNTVIDACNSYNFNIKYGNDILITLHRRENFGDKLKSIFKQINHLASEYPKLNFIFPMHPNPNVQNLKYLLNNVNVIEPLSYKELIHLLSRVKFVISDSGGIQEECAAFKKKILVCRDTTERPEGIDAGFAKIIGTDVINNFNWAFKDFKWSGENPYGNGNASKKIVDIIKSNL
tara:strand:+ start:3123 stop:4076 length:954 start_codon:yes stop_codon:yes gene_type:complete